MTQRKILCIVPDLLIAVRIEAAAKALGARVDTVGPEDAVRLIVSSEPDLVVADLGAPGLDLKALVGAARGSRVPLIGFYPHVDVSLRRAAQDAGVDHVYARSRFLGGLQGILSDALGA